jgi:hypothetical protein
MTSSVVGVLLRLTNVIVALFGVALLVFGIYMTVEIKGISAVPAIVLCLGTIDTLFGLIIVTCGFKSIFVLRLYMLILGLCVRHPAWRQKHSTMGRCRSQRSTHDHGQLSPHPHPPTSPPNAAWSSCRSLLPSASKCSRRATKFCRI